MEKSLKKIFAELDAIKKRLDALDQNGQLEEIKRQIAKVAANSQVVVNTVQTHGDVIQRLERTLTRLDIRCPLMKPDTDEFQQVLERKELKDE